MKDKFKKITAFILFVIVVIILTIIIWRIISNALLLSSYSKAVTPIENQTLNNNDFSIFSFNLTPPGILSENTAPKISKKDLGEISPLAGKLQIVKEHSELTGNTDNEYLYIVANINNSEAINISGMLLQSLVSNKIASIPQGAELFVLGQINTAKDIYLKPGEAAIIHTGKSPLGISFKSNMCSGYLNEFKDFKPKLATAWCPLPRNLLPNTVANIKKYGDTCIEYVSQIQRCQYYKDKNIKVTSSCKQHLKTILTYNYCVDKYQDSKNFYYPGAPWNVYLGRDTKLWKDKYEVIRLMDKDSKTIHALSI